METEQIHVESLADHISGRESGNEEERWEKHLPAQRSPKPLSAEVS